MSKTLDNILQAIGETPLVKLNRLGADLAVNLYAKVEFFNPGGSIKDRIALRMIKDAENRGLLKPGGMIVEATAGNTGAGLAMVAAVKGYKCIFVMPDKMSSEKVNLLKAYGAEVVMTPTAVPPDAPENYNNVAKRLARELGAFHPAQFENSENPKAHYLSTGPEIVTALSGQVDAFVAGAGTGGTVSGAGRYIKEKYPGAKVILADPEGSILSGDEPKPFAVEGIGEDFFPHTYSADVVDHFVRVSDAESFAWAQRLAQTEGILAGGSAGCAMAAAVKFADQLPAGANIVVMLPDTGRNYLSKVFNQAWLEENNYLPKE